MANPLTQHPPSSLPFPTAPRPSPIGFGFGNPSTPLSSFPNATASSSSTVRTPFPSFGSSVTPTTGTGTGTGNGFGSGFPASSAATQGYSTATSSPSKRALSRPSPLGFKSQPSLKRTRKNSSSSESTIPSSPRNSSSPQLGHSDLPHPRAKDRDVLSVGRLDLGGDGGSSTSRKIMKRMRSEPVTVATSSGDGTSNDADVGVLLAALPPSSHLSILMNVLQCNPSLVPSVLQSLPQPDLDECLGQMEKIISRVRRKAGSSNLALDQSRAWMRIQEDVLTYCRTSSTYISFFTSPPGKTSAQPDPQTIQTLLFSITSHVYNLLQLVPPDADAQTRGASASSTSGSVKALLDLGILIVKSWSDWVSGISTEVNQHGGMFPRGMVEGWTTNLESLARHPAPVPSSIFDPTPLPTTLNSTHPLVGSFTTAMVPIFERFISEVGWLIGRHPVFSSVPPPQHAPLTPTAHLGSASQWGSSRSAISAGGSGSGGGMSFDEDL